jgi:LysR family glycine cleavage system transcriptional activator
MHLTRSAVSHQLRLLEKDLGFPLLERVGKGVALTGRGRRYAREVHKALAMLGEATAQYREGGASSHTCRRSATGVRQC